MSTQSERDLLIAISRLPFMAPRRLHLLLEVFRPLSTVLRAAPATIAELLSISRDDAAIVRDPLAVPEIARRTAAVRENVVTLLDDAYPQVLKEIHDPPGVLHFRGDLDLASSSSVAVVGSRRASPYALNVAARLARDLACAGLTVVSGLARGVDAAAHAAALDAGGKTVAVLGTGIDVVYPRCNSDLRKRIESEGLVVTELKEETPPLAANFPVRNRVIAGLSLGTVVVEATDRSGSLITARLAAEEGREVFAVPGSIFGSGSVGPHRLIQYGAKLVHDVEDILSELRIPSSVASRQAVELGDELARVLAVLSFDEPLHVDEAAVRLRSTPGELAAALLELELRGCVRAVPGGRYIRSVERGATGGTRASLPP